MASDNITRKLRILRDAAKYDCGSYIQELIDDLASAINAETKAKETSFVCPVCGSDSVYGERFEYGTDEVWQPCGCYDCGASWNEVYRFAFKDTIRKGDR